MSIKPEDHLLKVFGKKSLRFDGKGDFLEMPDGTDSSLDLSIHLDGISKNDWTWTAWRDKNGKLHSEFKIIKRSYFRWIIDWIKRKLSIGQRSCGCLKTEKS